MTKDDILHIADILNVKCTFVSADPCTLWIRFHIEGGFFAKRRFKQVMEEKLPAGYKITYE